MEVEVILFQDESGEGWCAECPDVPGAVSQGDTTEEALANIREAAELVLEDYMTNGWPPVSPTTEDLPKANVSHHRMTVSVSVAA